MNFRYPSILESQLFWGYMGSLPRTPTQAGADFYWGVNRSGLGCLIVAEFGTANYIGLNQYDPNDDLGVWRMAWELYQTGFRSKVQEAVTKVNENRASATRRPVPIYVDSEPEPDDLFE